MLVEQVANGGAELGSHVRGVLITVGLRQGGIAGEIGKDEGLALGLLRRGLPAVDRREGGLIVVSELDQGVLKLGQRSAQRLPRA